MKPQATIEQKAEKLLIECDVLRAPVPLDSIVHHLEITAQARPLADASGVLVVENGRGVIGYNVDHSQVRQRFTIAHEIGHYVLHATGTQQKLFVDKSMMFKRNEDSSTGDDRMEVEANQFAAALLMPEKLIRAHIAKTDFDLDDEEDVSNLARQFNVSAAAMTFRLKNLGLFRD